VSSDPEEPRTVEVSIDEDAPAAEVDAIQQLLEGAGLPARVRANYARRSLGPLPWAMYIEAGLGVLALAFLQGLGGEAGRDAWRGLKHFVAQVFELRRRSDRPDGSIRVDDNDLSVILTDKIPDEGFRELMAGEFANEGYCVWNEEESRWQQF
jgi:hypothetical protein